MISEQQVIELISAKGKVLTTDGDVLGYMERLFVDDETGRPAWVTVTTGEFGSGESFIPLPGATSDGTDLHVPFSRQLVDDAPKMSEEGHLDPEEERLLLRHYSLEGAGGTAAGGPARNQPDPGVDQAGSGNDGAMTRSEERLRVGTETTESGRVRITKHIVTETVTQTIPVRREEIRIEHLPAGDTEYAAGAGTILHDDAFGEGDFDIVLYEERPVISVETVAVERIRVRKETITSHETISEDVRKEVIEADGVDERPAGL